RSASNPPTVTARERTTTKRSLDIVPAGGDKPSRTGPANVGGLATISTRSTTLKSELNAETRFELAAMSGGKANGPVARATDSSVAPRREPAGTIRAIPSELVTPPP